MAGITFQYVEPKNGATRTYSDNLCVSQSESGLSLTFGERIDVNPDRALIENRVVVTLSWLEAKRAVDFIQSYIAEFEKNNGAIEPPKLLPNPSVSVFVDDGTAVVPAVTTPSPNLSTDQKKVN